VRSSYMGLYGARPRRKGSYVSRWILRRLVFIPSHRRELTESGIQASEALCAGSKMSFLLRFPGAYCVVCCCCATRSLVHLLSVSLAFSR
jgi:hypothetical protein